MIYINIIKRFKRNYYFFFYYHLCFFSCQITFPTHTLTKRQLGQQIQVWNIKVSIFVTLKVLNQQYHVNFVTGANPPDLSFIALSRHGGEVSIHWLNLPILYTVLVYISRNLRASKNICHFCVYGFSVLVARTISHSNIETWHSNIKSIISSRHHVITYIYSTYISAF